MDLITESDITTGEVRQFTRFTRKISKSRIDSPFALLFFNACRRIAESDMSRTALRITMLLLTEIIDGSNVVVNSEMIAKTLGLESSGVRRAIKELTDKNILLKTETYQGRNHYMLNPHLTWRGGNMEKREYLRKVAPLNNL